MVPMSLENLSPKQKRSDSPRWNWTTKLIVGLALVAVAIWLLVQFQHFLGPIILAFILAYLFYPVANFLQKYIKLPWRLSVALIYIVVILVVLGLLTWGGLALFDQIQNLIKFINENINEIPTLISDFTQRTYMIGPFEFSFSGLNWNEVANEIVGAIRPVLGQVGSFAGSIATGAANVLFWLGLVMLISYFLLAETEGIPNHFLNINIAGYTEDLKRMGQELSKIWNAFIRGQIIVVMITIIIYTIFLGSMGVEFYFGLACVAALGRFVPYIGAWVTWITYGLVALLQNGTAFNLPNGIYALIILGVAIVIDSIIDNFLVPKVMSENLKVHPALVLVGALIAVNLLGIVGILLAAPVLATLKLILDYILHKLADENPWETLDNEPPPDKAKWVLWVEEKWQVVINWFERLRQKAKKKIHPEETPKENLEDSSEP